MVGLAATSLTAVTALPAVVFAGDLTLHPPKYPWSHNGPLNALDHSRLELLKLT